jgi:hypothetical protein
MPSEYGVVAFNRVHASRIDRVFSYAPRAQLESVTRYSLSEQSLGGMFHSDLWSHVVPHGRMEPPNARHWEPALAMKHVRSFARGIDDIAKLSG